MPTCISNPFFWPTSARSSPPSSRSARLALWVIQKIAEANKAAERPPRQPVRLPRMSVQAGAPAAGQQADPLRSQVEEFLRRADQGNPPDQKAAQPRKPPPRVNRAPTRRPITAAAGRAVGVPVRPIIACVRAEAGRVGLRQTARPPVGDTAQAEDAGRARRPRAAARTKSMAQQVSNLGQRIITEDQQFDNQLKAKFDHWYGMLAGSTVPETVLVPNCAKRLPRKSQLCWPIPTACGKQLCSTKCFAAQLIAGKLAGDSACHSTNIIAKTAAANPSCLLLPARNRTVPSAAATR